MNKNPPTHSITLVDKNGKKIPGKLYTDGAAEKTPQALTDMMGHGTFIRGRIECSLGRMEALFVTIETAECEHTKPGEVIGKAISEEGAFYKFQSI